MAFISASGQAEATVQHAADLRGDTQCQPVVVGDEYGFNRQSIVERQQ
ncbi:MAG: hypothetical protein HP490_05455 [Nitrospira sp.]|nr:hypothetical protein [Nitrospira sp.]